MCGKSMTSYLEEEKILLTYGKMDFQDAMNFSKGAYNLLFLKFQKK